VSVVVTVAASEPGDRHGQLVFVSFGRHDVEQPVHAVERVEASGTCGGGVERRVAVECERAPVSRFIDQMWDDRLRRRRQAAEQFENGGSP